MRGANDLGPDGEDALVREQWRRIEVDEKPSQTVDVPEKRCLSLQRRRGDRPRANHPAILF